MKVLQKNVLCRVGRDHNSGALFISKLRGLDEEIADQVFKELSINPEWLHDKTCTIKKSGSPSISGDDYLAEKIIRLEVAIVVAKCELIDDQEEE